MTTTRTDVHAPASADFDPEAYEIHGIYDLNPEWGNGRERQEAVNALINRGYRFGGSTRGTCGHCGNNRVRYVALRDILV